MRSKALWCVLSMVASTAMASDGTLNWAYQATGFQANGSSSSPQTALAMRDGHTWPVIFNYDDGSRSLSAYSLYPVTNPNPPAVGSNWFQIGSTPVSSLSGGGVLSAATSSDGRVGAVVRDSGGAQMGTAIVGSSSTGFGSPMTGVQAIDFNAKGGLVKGTTSTIPQGLPNMPTSTKLLDVAVSPQGDLGVLAMSSSPGTACYYQQSPLIGWAGTTFMPGLFSVSSTNGDLAMDSLGRPHIVGTSTTSPALIACDFDITTGQWKTQTLGIPATALFGATLAADSQGGVGAAWVQYGTSAPTLMYAYKDKDGIQDWAIHSVTSSVYKGSASTGDPLSSIQRVGLAFDANDFPVISFVAGSGSGNIWLAYDPPVGVPEPSTLVLLAMGAVLMLFVAGKSRLRRLLGK